MRAGIGSVWVREAGDGRPPGPEMPMPSRFLPACAVALFTTAVTAGALAASLGVAPLGALVPVGACVVLGAGLAVQRGPAGGQGAGAW